MSSLFDENSDYLVTLKNMTRLLDSQYRESNGTNFLTIEKMSPETFYKYFKNGTINKTKEFVSVNRFVKIYLQNIEFQPIITTGSFKVVGNQNVDEITRSKVNLVKISIQTVFYNRLDKIIRDKDTGKKVYMVDKGVEAFNKNLKHFLKYPDDVIFYFSSFTKGTSEKNVKITKIKGNIESFSFRQNAQDSVVYVSMMVNGKIID